MRVSVSTSVVIAVLLMAVSVGLAPAVAIAQPATAQSFQPSQQLDNAANSHYRLGLRLMTAEYWDDAAKEFQQAIDLDSRFTLAYYWLGRSRMSAGKFPDAVKALTECRELFLAELGQRASNQLSANQRRTDRLREIRELIREQQIGPATAGRDRTIMQLENLASDIEAQNTGASMDFVLRVPAFVSLSLGSAYFRSNSMAQAEEHFRAAIDANPKMGEAHNNLAVLLLMNNRVRDAEAEVKLAEKNKFRVNPALKEEIRERKKLAESVGKK